MPKSTESLTFATQGGEYSYHAQAARMLAGDLPVVIKDMRKFGPVVRASRNAEPGLGVIAIRTVAGTVQGSAAEIVRHRPSALPPIVARVNLPVELALIGSEEQTIEELAKQGKRCLAQKEAYQQCDDYLKQHTPYIKKIFRGESTEAVMEVVDKKTSRYVAIGPAFAAEALGGVIVGPSQINPIGSITSFYALQRDPRQNILPADSRKTAPRTIISIAHPEGDGEFEKCLEVADRMDVKLARFLPFAKGDFTKHNREIMRTGGLLELSNDLYDEELTEFCARVNGLEGNDGVNGPFDTVKLGCYPWFPDEPVTAESILATVQSASKTT